jgi:hypothetical protein
VHDEQSVVVNGSSAHETLEVNAMPSKNRTMNTAASADEANRPKERM